MSIAWAVAFSQPFGSTRQVTPHPRVLCPGGLFAEAGDGAVRLVALPLAVREDNTFVLRLDDRAIASWSTRAPTLALGVGSAP